MTSLPGRHGIGDLGKPAMKFLDWLQAAGCRMWQMLPIGPLGKGDSPYSSPSSFAIEPLLLSLDALVEDGLLPRSALRAPETLQRGNVRFASVRRFKEPRIHTAYETFFALKRDRKANYKRFTEREQHWLPAWCDWATEHWGDDPEKHAFTQFMLDQQWRALRKEAKKRGILLFGDLPIFVPLESADVESHPELFKLLPNGKPKYVTGVPPDRFSKSGQLWGHPQYRWNEHKKTKFRWWVHRVAKQFDRFDIVRIDHFIGLHHAWQIAGTARTARQGTWVRTPGRQMLERVFQELNAPALVAEDLGKMTPAVAQLRDDFALPGLFILQQAFERDDAPDMPHKLPKRSIAYPGTHDNDTAVGWWRTLPQAQRERAQAYSGPLTDGPHKLLLRLALASRSNAAIISMQDLLGLGRRARMNLPGTAKGNWRWRLDPEMLRIKDAIKLRSLVSITGRLDKERQPKKTK